MVGALAKSGTAGRLTVDLGALVKNWRALDQISSNALTAAVVKADAYGLGIDRTSRALFAAGTRFFFVANIDEGLQLRRILPEAHIFIFNGVYPKSAETLAANNLMPIISSIPMLEEWLSLCLDQNEALPAGLQFDTGINRLGFRLQETTLVREQIEQFGYMPQMVMSHFACADQPGHEKNRTQLALFQAVLAQFPSVPASLANSAGLMTSRDHHFQMVRPGIALYGGRAVNGRKNPMSPVVKLEVPILQIKEIKTGESVGYGASFTIDRDSRIAVIAMGYADGLLRSLSATNTRHGGNVIIRNRLLPIVGRVSMDMVAVDITDLGTNLPDRGERAIVLNEALTVDDQAEAGGTIGYEILTSLNGRYERIFADGGNSGQGQ